ncbi:cytochrome c4 [Chitinimonas arctica]|uniref:Cytochrome c4 n=1 Tax=Chitinimonas arctica TaxID=2594795 RepID=A0A516SES3_9NEIS|nr:c-type cytochrome [Chitinimonas arctica]QDQ26657.1 cytochrome c4 [Chitinimonas arctica]
MKRSVLAVLLGFVATFAMAAEAPAPAVKADPAKGKVIVDNVCAACHGADGNSAASANPSLAGQHPEYIQAQLHAFKKGERKNPIMMGQVAAMSDDDMRNVSAYFGGQKAKERAGADKALMAAGKKIYTGGIAATGVPACMACHGPNGAGMPVQFPRLGGQHAAYVVSSLNGFKLATDRKNAIMSPIAAKLSDAEMKAVAEYIAGLR